MFFINQTYTAFTFTANTIANRFTITQLRVIYQNLPLGNAGSAINGFAHIISVREHSYRIMVSEITTPTEAYGRCW